MRRAAAWLLAAVLAGMAVRAQAAPVATPLAGFDRAGTAADRDLLERVMTEASVERSLPAPSWSAYSVDLGRALNQALARRFGRWFRWLESQGRAFQWLAWGLLVVPTLALAILLVRAMRRPRARLGLVPPRKGSIEATAPAARDREAWRAELERRLGEGDVAGALAALWSWLARSLSGGEFDGAWTTRELLERSDRRDLSPLGRTLDRMVYGPIRPASADVRLLLDRLEAALS